jgi:predicted acetyltransferase
MNLKLVRPVDSLRDAFLRAARDYVEHGGDAERDREYEKALADFPAYLAELAFFASHDEPRAGLVRQQNFWLTDGREIFGHLRLRHRLNRRLLQLGGHIGYDIPPSRRRQGYATGMLGLGLVEARAIGLNEVALTADVRNTPSIKVIERNGGILDAEYEFEGVVRRRYWIAL